MSVKFSDNRLADNELPVFFSPTDSQDLYEIPIEGMLETMSQLWQEGRRLVYVDNPSASTWLLDAVPSLKAHDLKLKTIANSIITHMVKTQDKKKRS